MCRQRADRSRGGDEVGMLALSLCPILAGWLFGYDLGAVPGCMLYIREPDQYDLDHTWQQILVSAPVLTAALSAAGSPLVVGLVGRVYTLAIASVCFCVGSVGLVTQPAFVWLMACRAVCGIGIGLSSSTANAIVADHTCERHRLRAWLLSSYPFFLCWAQFVSAIASALMGTYELRWGYVFAPQIAVSLALLLLCVTALNRPPPDVARPLDLTADGSESLTNDDKEAANQEDQDQDQKEEKAAEQLSPMSLVECVRTPVIRRLLLTGCLVHALQQMVAINTVLLVTVLGNIHLNWLGFNHMMYYSATMMEMTGISSRVSALWWACVPPLVQPLMLLPVTPAVDLIGRKPLLITSLTGTCACLFGLAGGFQLLQWGYIEHIPLIGLIVLYLVCYSMGVSSLPWVIVAELFPRQAKSVGTAAAVSTNWSCNLIMSLTFLTLFDTIGQPATYLLYAVVVFVGLLTLLVYLPETKGQNPDQLHATLSKVPLIIEAKQELMQKEEQNNDDDDDDDEGVGAIA